MSAWLCPQEWAQREFGEADLGHKARPLRAMKLAAALAENPAASIPQACGPWYDTKAAYQLFKAKAVTLQSLSQPHWERTRQQLRQLTEGAVGLVLHDTTTLSFGHPATAGLGPTTTDPLHNHGLLLHNSLAVAVEGQSKAAVRVLGLAYQQLWARAQQTPVPAPQGSQPLAAGPDPESDKWAAAAKQIGPGRWKHVGDAESDCWEMQETCQELAVGYVLRCAQGRRALAGHEPAPESAAVSLYELLRQQPVWGKRTLYVRSRPGQAAREAKLRVSAMAVTVLAPSHWWAKEHRRQRPRPGPIRCWAVRVWEVDAPADVQEPVEWMLLTDEPVETLEQALQVAIWYSCRWLVEELHKCLKTGCRVEERQLHSADRLGPLVGMLSVIAVRLLQLKQQVQVDGKRAARELVPSRYVRMLAHWLGERETISCQRFWRETAKLGGFLGRKSDGQPGWLTLWRGWYRLELMTEGYELAQRKRRRRKSG